MSVLKLSEAKIGTLRARTTDREGFFGTFSDLKQDWRAKTTSQSLFHRADNFPTQDAEAYHRNYMIYLERCWREHLGVVFTPDILWNSLLAELAAVVKSDPESYRPLFTDSPDKKEIIVFSGDPVIMPISVLIDALKSVVPTDTKAFLPEFSTSTMRSKHAFNCNFADMCSPYYNYSMMCCAFTLIDVRGTKDDYQRIVNSWDSLKVKFTPIKAYMNKVGKLLRNIVDNLDSTSFWEKMLTFKFCGSGSDVEVSGWLTDIYVTQPKLAYPTNFAAHVAKVSYKNIDDGKNYVMFDGLFFSKLNGDILEPNFGFAVYEQFDAPVVTQTPPYELRSETLYT